MIRPRFLLVTTLLLAVSGTPSVQAQDPDTGPPEVLIKLNPQPQGQPRKLVIGPRGVGICRNTDSCGDTVTFTWVGPKNGGEEIKITFDDRVLAKSCFGPAGEEGVTLTIDDNRVSLSLLKDENVEVKDPCARKVALLYSAACQGGHGGNCGGVELVDPGMIIDGGG